MYFTALTPFSDASVHKLLPTFILNGVNVHVYVHIHVIPTDLRAYVTRSCVLCMCI
jgi:hypothetical protein